MENYIAHRSEDGERVQSVREHLENTARLAGDFASVFGAKEIAYRCGLLHDIGKYSEAFRKRISEDGPRTDHSTAGALESFKTGDIYSAFCIAGHHGGLPDGGNKKCDTAETPTLVGRMKRQPGREIPDYSAFSQEIRVPEAVPPAFLRHGLFGDAFFIRMLFSALVDADYLDTEEFMSGKAAERGGYDDIDTLNESLTAYIFHWWDTDKPLNKRRCEILRACMEAGKRPRGLYTLTVPTGGGKTVSSLAFALRHAKAHGMKRVIYVIPYTNIIEQTAQVFGKIVGEENVLEHHARTEYDVREENGDASAVKKMLSSENWDAPLIVTTSVQFFESLFSNKSSRCRKLHSIAGSVLIFDEAQMLPVSYLRPCVAAISELVSHYGCTAVLCTATQPSLDGLFKEYDPDRRIEELCPNRKEQYDFFRRVRFQNDGKLSDLELAERLNGLPQVLCIVNSREEAQIVYGMLHQEGRFHLSTLMTPRDRKGCLNEIKRRLKDGLVCRVVSTSLVEAGVDLDFPVVFRAEAGLDSILQAAGRCNRENNRSPDESLVHIFEAEKPAPRLFEQNVAAARMTMRLYPDFASPEAIKNYFDFLYAVKGDALDQKHVMDAWQSGLDGGFLPFRSVAEMFKLIETATRTVYIPLGHGACCADRFHDGERSKKLFREAGMYAVEVYPQHYRALYDAGAVEELDESVSLLTDGTLYSRETGLSTKVGSGKALFS